MTASPGTLPLRGRTALVTGVSRRRGIGFAVARTFARLGASVFIHHYGPHDEDQPWGADDLSGVVSALRAELTEDARLGQMSADLRDPGRIRPLIDAASELTGSLDILVCNHARSGGDGSILDMTPEALDAFWQTNTRSTLLLTRAFALLKTDAPTAPARPGERIRGDRERRFTAPTAHGSSARSSLRTVGSTWREPGGGGVSPIGRAGRPVRTTRRPWRSRSPRTWSRT